MNIELLPTSYGVLCHRQYADRVRDALLPSYAASWVEIAPAKDTSKAISSDVGDEIGKCTVIPTPEEKGPRKTRTGYALLVIEGAAMSPSELPPMARKVLSWAGRLTHRADIVNGGTDADGHDNQSADLRSKLKPIISEIWNHLLVSSFNVDEDVLRIDVQPKSHISDLIRTAFTDAYSPKLACSASKVTHVVNMVISQNADAQANVTKSPQIHWGISRNKEHFEHLNQRLNDYATSEVVLESIDPKTGLDLPRGRTDKEFTIPWDAPVSRAYYKLEQVFEDDSLLGMLSSSRGNAETKQSLLCHGAGLDIGASPGGWTQVLCNTLGVSTAVGLDPGVLAQRVMKLPGVHHLCAELSSEESIRGIARHAPYSVIVCDASVSNANELIVKIVETLGKVASLLKKEDRDDNDQTPPDHNIFAWPLCVVITLKLPYKTVESINRNLEKVESCIPDYLRRIASLGPSADDVRYKVSHLFANSLSERTLIALFQSKSK